MHSLERYSGANKRIVRPKFRRVSEREACANASSSWSDFGAIRCSKRSTSFDLRSAKLSRVSTNDIKIISDVCERSQIPTVTGHRSNNWISFLSLRKEGSWISTINKAAEDPRISRRQ